MSLSSLQVRMYGSADARTHAGRLVEVYADVYADKIDDPFFSVQRFAERLERHQSVASHTLVTGEVEGALVGYAYGACLGPRTLWWDGLREPYPPDLVRETGDRTFALNEIMVREAWQRRGIARRLHDALLGGRPEERATLLVEQENTPARTAYERWGWREVGHLQPFPDAPVYVSMVLGLGVVAENKS